MEIKSTKKQDNTISFTKTWQGTQDDLPFFRGTISCGPSTKQLAVNYDLYRDYYDEDDHANE